MRQMQDLFRPAEADEKMEKTNMNNLFLAMYMNLNNLVKYEEGQDLIEYALVAALIALVSVAMIQSVGSAVNTVFSDISSALG